MDHTILTKRLSSVFRNSREVLYRTTLCLTSRSFTVTHLIRKPSSVMVLNVHFLVPLYSFLTLPHSANTFLYPLSIMTSTLATHNCSYLSPRTLSKTRQMTYYVTPYPYVYQPG